MASMNISLPDPMWDSVQARVDKGTHASSSDYVRDLIRRKKTMRDNLQALQQVITEGLQSGEPRDFDFEAFRQLMLESQRCWPAFGCFRRRSMTSRMYGATWSIFGAPGAVNGFRGPLA